MIFKKIGIFDSGIGGLSLVKELITVPGLELIYYADTAHVPYGNRSKEEIEILSIHAVHFLLQHSVDAIIIACHTATTNALPFLKAQFPHVYFIDVVELIVSQMVHSSAHNIGILGTQATITSGVHKSILTQALPNASIFTQACPSLASAIENNLNDAPSLLELLKNYCISLRKNEIDTLVLACTHYALIKSIIAQVFDSVTLISAEQALHKKLSHFLDQSATHSTQLFVHTTADIQSFLMKASAILDLKSLSIQQATASPFTFENQFDLQKNL